MLVGGPDLGLLWTAALALKHEVMDLGQVVTLCSTWRTCVCPGSLIDLNGAIRYLSKKHLICQGDGCACQPDAGLPVGRAVAQSRDLPPPVRRSSLTEPLTLLGLWGAEGEDMGPGRGKQTGESVTPHRALRPPDSWTVFLPMGLAASRNSREWVG